MRRIPRAYNPTRETRPPTTRDRPMTPRPFLLAALLAVAAAPLRADEPAQRYARRWVYCSHNLLVPQQVEAVIGVIERAGRAGYNGVVLTDFKFNILGRMPPNYFRNVERVKAAAARA